MTSPTSSCYVTAATASKPSPSDTTVSSFDFSTTVYLQPETPIGQLTYRAYMSWRQNVTMSGLTVVSTQPECAYTEPVEVRYPFGGKQYAITVTGMVHQIKKETPRTVGIRGAP